MISRKEVPQSTGATYPQSLTLITALIKTRRVAIAVVYYFDINALALSSYISNRQQEHQC